MYLQATFILPLTGQPSTESALGKRIATGLCWFILSKVPVVLA